MSDFSPKDGALYFAWRNTFKRVNERTYDWTFRHGDVVSPDGYIEQETLILGPDGEMQWVAIAHERTFLTEEQVQRYCLRIQRLFDRQNGSVAAKPALRVTTDKSRVPQSGRLMHYADGVLTLPHPQTRPGEKFSDATGEVTVRERFIADRWTNGQRGWPVLEHHLLHELAHHVSGDDKHSDDFTASFRTLLGIASESRSLNPTIWDNEIFLSTRLFEQGESVVDMETNIAYKSDGTIDALAPANA